MMNLGGLYIIYILL